MRDLRFFLSLKRRLTIIAALGLGLCLMGCYSLSVTDKQTVRVATFNVFLNRNHADGLINDLMTPENEQAKNVAEIIQRNAPDILVLNEFDYDPDNKAAALFQENYLSISQNGAQPIEYRYVFSAPVNTGLHSGHDLDGNGEILKEPGSRSYGGDSFGFGAFEGQYGMLILSKYPIGDGARTFQNFLWKDMPGALLPDNADTGIASDWYSEQERAIFRLSSKSHWDVPILIGDQTVHVLASHPTPPAFDGDEDRNGRRNFDENRFWADYISAGKNDYIYDDAGHKGGLTTGSRFVIAGDLNADPVDAGAIENSSVQLLGHPLIVDKSPASEGGIEQSNMQGGINLQHAGPPLFDTADFDDRVVGNLRLDYVLPSVAGWLVDASGVFWPKSDDPLFRLTGSGSPVLSSDHRLVWIDLTLVPIDPPNP